MSTGLSALKQQREEIAEQERQRNRPKAGWFTPPKDGTPVKVRFLNELDPEAKLYNEAHGLYLTEVEHMAPGPKGYMSRAVDTMKTEGRDWAQEQHLKDPKAGWKPRKFFYINVAVEEDGKVVPKIAQRNLSNQFVADLIEYYEEDSDFEGITGTTFWIKRTGEGTNTQWRLKVAKPEDELDVSGVQPWDLNEYAVRHVPYDEQEKFYKMNAQLPESDSAPREESSSRASAEKEGDWDW